ncbi:carotenoid cleavage dioxygenase 7, chloroplastic-like [Lolium rigidum]|uniref:carotenoid cleavage dioxygenase 7, chloroplastic-like n=1 Tax=Lolium rigidum TaxID=89674 RepID=UPI001F5C3824|nr:carotenoid cleavage dioxygenase 7, chloroplastic-like [Lolium rigidum]
MAVCTMATMHAAVHHHHHPLLNVPPPPRHRVRVVVRGTAGTTAAAVTSEPDTFSNAFWDYNLLFRSQRAETSDPVQLRVVEGAIPADFPAGTYYLAGPGMFSDDHGSIVHPLDGHGYLRSFRFHPDHGVHYAARYVETAAKSEEKGDGASWKFTHRGPFSVLQGGHRVGNVKVMKNVANTSVLWWGGRLLCLWEGGMPYELDPNTLETIGPFDLLGLADEAAAAQGRVTGRPRQRRPWLVEAGLDVATRMLRPILSGVFSMPPKRLLAHYKVDPKRNRLLMVACNAEDMLLPRANFTFYEFDVGFGLVQKREFVLPAHLMIHDWAFTDSHYVVLGNRIKLDIPGSALAMTGTYPMIGALQLDPSKETTPVYLLPRSTEALASGRDWTVPVEAPAQMWSMHVGNAFEEDLGRGGMDIRLHMSACSYEWFHFHRMFGYSWKNKKLDPTFMNAARGKELLPRLVQVAIELDKRGACRRCSVKRMSYQWNKPADFPAINPSYANKRSRFIYAGGASGSRKFLPYFPFDSVVKVDVSDGTSRRWSCEGRKFVGEPVFIPTGGGEDHGYVIIVEYAVSEDRCNLVVLDARKIGKKSALVAKLQVPKHLTFPMGFHGFWADE